MSVVLERQSTVSLVTSRSAGQGTHASSPPKMTTPGDGSSTAEPEQSTPIIPAIIPAPYTTNEQHVCFICLQNDTDTPNATWVNTCPCSLEAHEHCMLRWIAEVENDSARPKDGLKCPACKAPINVDEPYDPVVALRDGLYRRYSRLSPYILLMLVSGGTIAGSAWYGQKAASIFAGPDAVAAWMGSRARRGMPSVLIKTLILSSIGPSLVVTRWLSSLGIIVLLPCSVLVGNPLILSLCPANRMSSLCSIAQFWSRKTTSPHGHLQDSGPWP